MGLTVSGQLGGQAPAAATQVAENPLGHTGFPSCQKWPCCPLSFIFLTVIFQDVMTHGEKTVKPLWR